MDLNVIDEQERIDIIEEEFLNLQYYKRKKKELKESPFAERDYKRLHKKCKGRLKNLEKSFPEEYTIAKLKLTYKPKR